MHIQKAIPENLIEIMYLLRKCIEDFNENNIYQWNISYPDDLRLIQEIEKGSLYLMINKGVPIATITFDEEQDEVFTTLTGKIMMVSFLLFIELQYFLPGNTKE